jgi:hypothetical protein
LGHCGLKELRAFCGDVDGHGSLAAGQMPDRRFQFTPYPSPPRIAYAFSGIRIA